MSTSANFLKGEFGFQSAFGTPAVPHLHLPFTGAYEDAQEDHEAEYDAGTWISSNISAKTNDYATFTLEGSGFFELLPLFINAGLSWTAATSGPVGPPQLYTYDDSLSISAEGAPRPITFRFGGNEKIGIDGPAVQIADAYCQSLTLSGGVNNRVAQVRSTWFGLSVDDNSGKGYDLASASTPPLLNFIRAVGNAFELLTATTTGGVFAGMTATNCKMTSWEMTINTGAMPKWGADAAAFTYCGVRFEAPSIEFRPVIRTDSATYALIRTAYDDRTYQELQWTLNGDDGRLWLNQWTGRWIDVPTAHARAEGEVVMNPVWRTERYPSQTTTPHVWSWQLDTAADITLVPTDLLTNGGFEGTYTAGLAASWTATGSPTTAEETTTVHGGSKSQSVTASASSADNINQDATVTIGDVLRTRVWIYRVSGTGDARINTTSATAETATLITGQWVLHQIIATATATTESLQLYGTDAATVMLFDDASVEIIG